MNVFISGGCKNGKSYYAQELALSMALEEESRDGAGNLELPGKPGGGAKTGGLKRPLYYIATMIPKDDEDRLRIERHLQARDGWGFETIEVGTGLLDILGTEADPEGSFLLDSVTALLSNEMFRADGSYDPDAGVRLSEELAEFAARTGNTVFVSDFIYSDARRYDDWTENYRRALALCDRRLAEVCDRCLEVSYGTINVFK